MLKYDPTLNKLHHIARLSFVAISLFSLAACSFSGRDGAPKRYVNVANIPDAVPKVEPRSEGGNPSSYSVFGRTYYVMRDSHNYVERGIASWYGTKFHGNKTSNGETYDMYKMTAAHKSLPIPTYVQVTNLKNGRKVIVRVNDRGPFHHNRIIDLSYVAAKKLGIIGTGTGLVEVRSINPRTWRREEAHPVRTAIKPDSYDTLYIQAGAFASQHNASRLQRQLNALFPDHPVQLAQNSQDQLFRVRIGPLATVAEADRVAQTISENGYPTPHVILE
ncbi:MAG: septal ring lytic transglycosylase RlpA family protein [Thioalkalispiraceae bacterium]|jgi:rare lipoprotein A